jgi:hypothetical protein
MGYTTEGQMIPPRRVDAGVAGSKARKHALHSLRRAMVELGDRAVRGAPIVKNFADGYTRNLELLGLKSRRRSQSLDEYIAAKSTTVRQANVVAPDEQAPPGEKGGVKCLPKAAKQPEEAVVSRLFSWALDRELIEAHPCARLGA